MAATNGRHDLDRAIANLSARLPNALRPLGPVVYNYLWSWTEDGRALFHDLDCERWHLCRGDPVRLIEQLSASDFARIESSPELMGRIGALADRVQRGLDPHHPPGGSLGEQLRTELDGPVAFVCSEFAIHGSLPVYAGGLGVLAGDMLKEASDLGLPYIGIGLLYRRGYFQQRLDLTGWQHEWWDEIDPEHSSASLVTVDGVEPLLVTLPLFDRVVTCQVWRVDVGRVPLYLLDTERPENHPIDRFITARLYEGNRALRLAQYAVLGVGGMRVLRALGYDPSVVHLNEGHAVIGLFELERELIASGVAPDEAFERARAKVVFTTHTPVPAGNERYGVDEALAVFGHLLDQLGVTSDRFIEQCRFPSADNGSDDVGFTPFALRASRKINGVSERHGEVARAMWHPLFADRTVDDVPIGFVTNGVHLPTFMAPPIRHLLDDWLEPGWLTRVTDPGLWRAVAGIPAADLWAARCRTRAGLIERVRRHSITDRLQRGEELDYVEAAAVTFDDEVLTLGFARRVATYKRLQLLSRDPARALALLNPPHPIQLLIAGKAHPADTSAKEMMQQLFSLKGDARVARQVAVLENYDLSMAPWLVAGCDVWVNLPRPPNEASGTSGMKAAMNGGLNLSVLDGWWAEGYDGSNGWAIEGSVDDDEQAQDDRHAALLYELLEQQVVPLFYERDADGVPLGWVEMIKASWRTLIPRFAATRMVTDYVRTVYRT